MQFGALQLYGLGALVLDAKVLQLHLVAQVGRAAGVQEELLNQEPGVDEQPVQVLVAQADHLRDERVRAQELAQQRLELALGRVVERLPAVHRWLQLWLDLAQHRARVGLVEVDGGDGLYLRVFVHVVAVQPLLQVVDDVGVGRGVELGCLVIIREARPYGVPRVGEVNYEGALAGYGACAVQAAQGLYGCYAGEHLVYVHRAELGLIETGLELVGAHDDALLVRVEELGGAGLGHAVHLRLGDLLAVHVELAGERHHDLAGVLLLLYVFGHRKVEPVGHRPAPSDDHGLGLAVQHALHVVHEVLNDDLRLLADHGWVPVDNPHKCAVCLHLLVLGVVCDGLHQFEVALEAGVVLQHVQDEALVDGLLHAV